MDLASEHERFLTEKVYKQPLIVYNYPKDIKVRSPAVPGQPLFCRSETCLMCADGGSRANCGTCLNAPGPYDVASMTTGCCCCMQAFYMRLNDDGKTVAAMDVLVPKIGELIGGAQREERLEVCSLCLQIILMCYRTGKPRRVLTAGSSLFEHVKIL